MYFMSQWIKANRFIGAVCALLLMGCTATNAATDSLVSAEADANVVISSGDAAPLGIKAVADQAQVNNQPVSRAGDDKQYLIGPGDVLQFFVWRNSDLSVTVPVRPDGRVSIPLVEDLSVIARTPNQVARDVEKALSVYIKNPIVTVIITQFGGIYGQQIRIIGAAVGPKAMPYQEDMSLLDAMIAVGGLTEFAAGNRSKVVRKSGGKNKEISVRLEDLLKKGDVSANIDLQPGDVIIIPETWF